MHALYKSLSPKGVVAMHLGMASFGNDPVDQYTPRRWRSSLVATLEKIGFGSIYIYEDGNCAFGGPVLFLVTSKDEELSTKELWFRSPALMELEIRKRMHVTSELSLPSLQYFDSGVMSNFLHPHKSVEVAFCKSIPAPESCSFIVHEKLRDAPLSTLDVRPSTIGNGSGRGVFATVDIDKGSTIARDARFVLFRPSSTLLVYKYMDMSKSLLDVHNYFEGYGWQTDL